MADQRFPHLELQELAGEAGANHLSHIKSTADFRKQWDSVLANISRQSANPFPKGQSRAHRLEQSKSDIWNFAAIYLPHYASKAAAPFHAQWQGIACAAGEPILVEAFREAGKSTFFSFIDCIHALLFGRARYMLIGAYTESRAQMFTGRILAELQANQRLIADFGTLVDPARHKASIGLFELYCANDLATVQAISIGQNPRGLVAGPHRPDYVRLDDLQDRKLAKNRRITEDRINWVIMDLVPALAESYNLKIVATQVCKRDIVEQLREGTADRPALKSYRFPLLDSQGHSTWLQQYSPKRIENLRKTLGRRAFNQEYLLQVVGDEDGKLQEDWLRYYDPALITHKQYQHKVMFLDLGSYKTSDKHDYKAAIVLGGNPGPELDVLAAHIKRQTPLQFVRSTFDLFELWQPQEFWWEDNGQQSIIIELFLQEEQRRKIYLPRKPHTNRNNKESRIEGTLFPLIENGKLYFHPTNAMQKLLIDQLLDFPDGQHDDGPDALEGAAAKILARLRRNSTHNSTILRRRAADGILRGY